MGFNPYTLNGGTILGLAGDDFAIVASDTRLSEGYSIHTRDCPKTYQLTDTSVLACTGCHCDVLTLTKLINARLKMYEHEHNTKMSTAAIASMISTMLYYKRFFPYYAYNIIGGLDENGKGCVYSYDPVGHYQKESFKAAGTGGTILQPLLDNQIGFKNQNLAIKPAMQLDKAVRMVKDVFTSAAERDIYTGDAILINVITKDGVKKERFLLRRD